MARNKSYCWKCSEYIQSHDRNWSGLCGDCVFNVQLTVYCMFVGFMVMLVWNLVPEQRLIVKVGHAFLTILFAVLISIIAYGIFSLIKKIAHELVAWATALGKLTKDIIEERKEQELEEAKQRALEADARRLDGMQLDALLTEQLKEKNGWN